MYLIQNPIEVSKDIYIYIYIYIYTHIGWEKLAWCWWLCIRSRKTYSLPSWWLPFFFEYLFGLWIKLKWLSHINEYCQFLFFYFLLRITTIIIFLQGQWQLLLIGCLFFLQNAKTSGIISYVDFSKSTKPLLDNWVWNVQLFFVGWVRMLFWKDNIIPFQWFVHTLLLFE